MVQVKYLVAASALGLLVSSSPSFADKPDIPPGQAKKIEREHIPPGQGKKVSRAAPGPVAGLGLPFAAAAGGFVWWRNRRRKPEKT